MTSSFNHLREEQDFVDCTISCQGRKLAVHKVVLSACSTYFHSLFKDSPCSHPVVIMNGFQYSDLEALVEFMYCGQVNVPDENLTSFFATASTLNIKGLADYKTNESAPFTIYPYETPKPKSVKEENFKTTSRKQKHNKLVDEPKPKKQRSSSVISQCDNKTIRVKTPTMIEEECVLEIKEEIIEDNYSIHDDDDDFIPSDILQTDIREDSETVCSDEDSSVVLPDRRPNHTTPENGSRVFKAKRCGFCPRSRDRKSKIICNDCNIHICGLHKVIVCMDCHKKNSGTS